MALLADQFDTVQFIIEYEANNAQSNVTTRHVRNTEQLLIPVPRIHGVNTGVLFYIYIVKKKSFAANNPLDTLWVVPIGDELVKNKV